MPIYLRITVDGVSKEISTGRQRELFKWNAHAQRAAGTNEEAKALNVYLDTLQAKVYEAKRQLLENKQTITAGTGRAAKHTAEMLYHALKK